ncbi:hypothetical protein [Streptomyces gibsoniae]|uniref:FXSXX-COOH protein n=1 Tax=Streptomyces gibsoniae TaxID=3075529 RepID=A0ABU2UAS8_9ACTN|nr:hypothetical protein [Streptomyces sp. DSM 41699]MDT0470244.1 hypothetical protein [Streptomyces sp. DSM 41699]
MTAIVATKITDAAAGTHSIERPDVVENMTTNVGRTSGSPAAIEARPDCSDSVRQ